MAKEQFRVKYKIPKGQSTTFDNEIRKFAKKLGFKWWASGYDYIDGYRDLAFERRA